MEQQWTRRASDRILQGGVLANPQQSFAQGFTQQPGQFSQTGGSTQQQAGNPQQYSSDRQQQQAQNVQQTIHGLPQIAGRRLTDQLSLMYSGLLLHNISQNVVR